MLLTSVFPMHLHTHTHTNTNTNTRSYRNLVSNMGFMPTSTTHIDRTVICSITHDTVNFYKHDDLPVN